MVHGRSVHGSGAVILVLNAAKVDPVVEDEPAGVGCLRRCRRLLLVVLHLGQARGSCGARLRCENHLAIRCGPYLWILWHEVAHVLFDLLCLSLQLWQVLQLAMIFKFEID